VSEYVDRYGDATATVCGLPYRAAYRATRKSDGFYYMYIQYSNMQGRKWINPQNVIFKRKITEILVNKVTDIVQ
jgi:hypothetical protein